MNGTCGPSRCFESNSASIQVMARLLRAAALPTLGHEVNFDPLPVSLSIFSACDFISLLLFLLVNSFSYTKT